MLSLPFSVQAQMDQWYQVELLVFSRPAGAGAEHWDAMPELAYPARSRFLIYPGEQPTPTSTTSIPDRNVAAAEPTVQAPQLPTAFATLAPGQRQLSGSAAAMQRSGRYRILFHEAWIQPMTDKGQTLPIILDRSGDGGQWPALQGSIKLYLSRYFYLDTNLWLNTGGEYLQGDWRMPAPPLAPASRPQEVTAYSSLNRSSTALPAAEPAGELATAGSTPATTETATLGPQYPFRHAVLLNTTRRMRSGELVYIDHPLLGVLIRITPLQTEEG